MLDIKGIKRLQGSYWKSKKKELTLAEYEINEKGHILGIYTDENNNKFCHWLSDSEIETFNKKKEKEED